MPTHHPVKIPATEVSEGDFVQYISGKRDLFEVLATRGPFINPFGVQVVEFMIRFQGHLDVDSVTYPVKTELNVYQKTKEQSE